MIFFVAVVADADYLFGVVVSTYLVGTHCSWGCTKPNIPTSYLNGEGVYSPHTFSLCIENASYAT